MRITFLSVFVIVLSTYAHISEGADESTLECASAFSSGPENTQAIAMCQALQRAQQTIEDHGSRVQELEEQLQISRLSSEVPIGAVLAFDRRDGCPPNWSEFSPAEGRVIVGVGKRIGREGTYELLYGPDGPRYQQGGSEVHQLKSKEMPAHNHQQGSNLHVVIDSSYFNSPGTGYYAVHVGPRQGYNSIPFSAQTGEGEPHNNMPPFIALYYCKKNGS